LFTGYDEQARDYDKSSWDYELDEQGHARIDDTWQHPRCVINLLRKHVERYTPEMVSRICGTPQDKYPRGLRADSDHRGARQGFGQPVCTGLDAAFGRVPEHPHHGDGAAPAG